VQSFIFFLLVLLPSPSSFPPFIFSLLPSPHWLKCVFRVRYASHAQKRRSTTVSELHITSLKFLFVLPIMANVAILELNRNCAKTVEEIVKLERKIFPKHESLASFFHDELKKKNSGLLYLHVDCELAGYVMYSWPSSLYASITKLAGSNLTTFLAYI